MFQRKFPYINFTKTWELIAGVPEPREIRRIELRVVCDTKGDAPFYSVTSTSNPRPTVPVPSSSRAGAATTAAAAAAGSVAMAMMAAAGARRGGTSPSAIPTSYEEVSIGRIIISEKTSWGVLEALISRAFKRFLMRPGSYCDLGLGPESIYAWEIPSQILLEFKSQRDRPEISPIHCFKDDYQTRVLIYLKGASQGAALDGMAFQTQLSKANLGRHIARLEGHGLGRVVFYGPRFVHSRIEMSFVAKKMAEYLVVKERGGIMTRPERERRLEAYYLAMYNAMDPLGRNAYGLAAFMEDITERVKLRREGVRGAIPPPHVVVVENLQAISSNLKRVVDEFVDFKMTCESEVAIMMGTYVTSPKLGETIDAWKLAGVERIRIEKV